MGLSLATTEELYAELVTRSKGCVIALIPPSNAESKDFVTYLDWGNIIATGGLLNILNARYGNHLSNNLDDEYFDEEEGEV
jgi:gamma-glutamyl-gamma-aminobutyrate hydrolase PuuD